MNNLEKYRKEANMSQEKLSEVSGVSRNTISQLERGIHTNVTRTVMNNLSVALNKNIKDIFFSWLHNILCEKSKNMSILGGKNGRCTFYSKRSV